MERCLRSGKLEATVSIKMERLVIWFLFTHKICKLGIGGKTVWDPSLLLSRMRVVRFVRP